MNYLKAKEEEIDRAIEARKRQLLASEIGNKIEPIIERVSELSTKGNKEIVEALTTKLEEMKELLNAEITIEI